MPEFDRFFPYKALRYSDVIDAGIRVIDEGAVIETLKAPVFATVYPTNICTANCHWCIMAREKQSHAVGLDLETLKKFWDDVNRIGVGYVHVSGGGEPLVSRHTIPSLRYNRTLKRAPRGLPFEDDLVRITMSTHGGLLTPEVAELVDDCRVSLNAGTKDVHDAEMDLPSSQNWDVVLDNVARFRERQKELYGGDCRKSIGLGFVVSETNWRSVLDFCRLGADLRLDFLHIRPAFYSRSDPRNEQVRDLIQHDVMPLVQKGIDRYGDRISIRAMSRAFEGYWTAPDYSVCRATPLEFVLKATGQFAICQDVLDEPFAWGDYRTMTFEQMWHSPEHLKALQCIDLSKCPRCIRSRVNAAIENVFVESDEVRTALI